MKPANPYARRYLTPRPELVTERERAVGALLASGLRRPEVAARLGIPEGSVDGARGGLYLKLGLSGIVDLTHFAIAKKWIRVRGRRGPGGKLRA